MAKLGTNIEITVKDNKATIVIDLTQQVVTDDQGFSARFSADPYGRELLLQGLDEIGRTLLEEPSVAAYERSHA